jgi:hypothetical protein
MPEIKDDISLEEYRAMKAAGQSVDSEPEQADEVEEKQQKQDVTTEEPSDSEPEIPEEEPELYNGKPPTDSQKRFKQLFGEYTPKDLAAKRKAAEEERAALEARVRVYESTQRQPEQRQTEAPKPETFRSRPKLDDFKTVEEWQDADTQWIDDRDEWKHSQREKQQRQQTEQQKQSARQQEAMRQVTEGRRQFRDFDIVLTAPISDVIANELIDDSEGYKVAYALAKQPDEARRISALPPSKQLMELGRFMAKQAPQAKKQSQPLKTPAKLSSGGGAQTTGDEKRIREIQERLRKMR